MNDLRKASHPRSGVGGRRGQRRPAAGPTAAQLEVLAALSATPKTIHDLCGELGMMPGSVSGHLLALRARGLAVRHLRSATWTSA